MRFRTVAVLVALALSTAAIPALAKGHTGHGTRADAADASKQKAQFPMSADAFRARVNERMAKMDAHVEKRIVDKKLDAAKANEVRQRVAQAKVKITTEVNRVCSDGVVTADEAREVRQAGRSLHKGHKKA